MENFIYRHVSLLPPENRAILAEGTTKRGAAEYYSLRDKRQTAKGLIFGRSGGRVKGVMQVGVNYASFWFI